MSNTQDDSLIIRTWHEIAVNALESRASDIHIEAGLALLMNKLGLTHEGRFFIKVTPHNRLQMFMCDPKI